MDAKTERMVEWFALGDETTKFQCGHEYGYSISGLVDEVTFEELRFLAEVHIDIWATANNVPKNVADKIEIQADSDGVRKTLTWRTRTQADSDESRSEVALECKRLPGIEYSGMKCRPITMCYGRKPS